MNCPVCKRELAPTLSICLTCGAMMNDTVREELETKIARPAPGQTLKSEVPGFEPIKPWVPQPKKIQTPEIPERKAEPVKPKVATAKLNKQTSPTLVDFQHSNPTFPEWRLQLQNSIRKRNTGTAETQTMAPVPVSMDPESIAAPIATPPKRPAKTVIQNEKLANAMKRIEDSKRTFGSGAAVGLAVAAQARASRPVVPGKTFPFDVVERSPERSPRPASKPELSVLPKPKLVSTLRIEKKKFDTNKLPPIPEPETPLAEGSEKIDLADTEIRTKLSFDRLQIMIDSDAAEPVEAVIEASEEIDDLAPLSMRFGAAVFDLIIGGFAAGILVSPLLVSNLELTTAATVLAVFGAAVVVMFFYFTSTVAFIGRTFGMKLFSIEIIDAEANELPTLHQAAVSSAVYLLSLMLLGLGFLPAFFNEERRAVHDLVSGTLLIREY